MGTRLSGKGSAMATAQAASAVSALGQLLRQWRRVRGVSQLELALGAGISPRHLSFVETGRAQPGRDVVLRLSSALDLPLRDRNSALIAAGYAPIYRQGSLQAPEMEPIVRAVDFLLHQLEPYPALVLDRLHNIVKQNRACGRLLGRFLDTAALAEARAAGPLNLYRLTLDPRYLRPWIANWEDVARVIVVRMRRGIALGHGGPDVIRFLEELLAMPGLPSGCDAPEPEAPAPPVIPVELRKDGVVLRIFTTLTSIGTPQDVTLQELTVESSFPADAETDAFLRTAALEDPAPSP
jgi:transcriptional regulator with XRE-family HTH domain